MHVPPVLLWLLLDAGWNCGVPTAGAPAVSCDQQSLAALRLTATATAVADAGTRNLFCNKIPVPFCQYKQTLKQGHR